MDGIFTSATTKATRDFQQKYGFPITGTVDRTTFIRLTDAYNKLLDKSVLSGFIRGFYGDPLRETNQSDSVFFLNIMLKKIASLFPNVSAPDAAPLYSSITKEAVKELQTVFSLPSTGVVDRRTWNSITGLYNDLMQTREGQI